MDELPSVALRTKKDSSMRVAINLVKEGRASACVSAGNTGALMATARFVLKTLPGIDRPAIISTLPSANPNKNVRMLDLGANVDSTAENLMQFAIMGSVLVSAVENIPNPKYVCLISAKKKLKVMNKLNAQLNYCRNQNYLIMWVSLKVMRYLKAKWMSWLCDGFVGNVALKTTEGAALLMRDLLKAAFKRNIFTKLVAVLVKPVLASFAKRINPDCYNGATFIGLQGTVIKSHGGAKIAGFAHAIEEAMIEAEKNVPELIRYEVEQLLKQSLPSQGGSL